MSQHMTWIRIGIDPVGLSLSGDNQTLVPDLVINGDVFHTTGMYDDAELVFHRVID
jgi:hypothetical protein